MNTIGNAKIDSKPPRFGEEMNAIGEAQIVTTRDRSAIYCNHQGSAHDSKTPIDNE